MHTQSRHWARTPSEWAAERKMQPALHFDADTRGMHKSRRAADFLSLWCRCYVPFLPCRKSEMKTDCSVMQCGFCTLAQVAHIHTKEKNCSPQQQQHFTGRRRVLSRTEIYFQLFFIICLHCMNFQRWKTGKICNRNLAIRKLSSDIKQKFVLKPACANNQAKLKLSCSSNER